MDSQIPLFRNFFIKNGSHDTIHTFKNYFATVFSVSVFSFSNNKLNPNGPIISHYKIITYSRASCNFLNNFHNDAKTFFFFDFSCKFNKSNEKKEAEDLIHYFKRIVPREVNTQNKIGIPCLFTLLLDQPKHNSWLTTSSPRDLLHVQALQPT